MYTIIAVAVVVFVTNNLTAQVDTQLASALTFWEHSPVAPDPASVTDTGQGDFGTRVLAWEIFASGSQRTNAENVNSLVQLPQAYVDTTSPTTAHIGGVDLRIAGVSINLPQELCARAFSAADCRGRLVVGYNVDSLSQTQSSLIWTESIAGVALLLLVFFGTLFVGRRVGAPDRARPPASARVHRRRLARAANPARGHRGPDEPRPQPGP